MDFWTFISKIIEALAWPSVVLYLILKFRDRFGSLLDRLTEATLPGGISGKFAPAFERAQEMVNEIPEPELAGGEEIEREIPSEKDDRALEINPSGVIMEMWQKVLAQAKELLESSGTQSITAGRPLSPLKLVRTLEANNLITHDESKLVDELRSIRNAVAHSETQATPADADRYRSFSEKLILTWVVRIANGQSRQ